MHLFLPVIALAGMLGVIWFLGTGRFGRAQTQGWIDRLRQHPMVFNFLDRHHGKFRAAAHYVEFGGLFLVLYWLQDAFWGDSKIGWNPPAAVIIALVCAAAAYLDELHQLRSGTRQFRRVDFLHSCCGISIAALLVWLQAWSRGV